MTAKIDWKARARRRWPRSNGFLGDGQFAVLTCAFYHTSGKQMFYSRVHLCETKEQAEELSKTVYCHAYTRDLCSGRHEIVDLAAI